MTDAKAQRARAHREGTSVIFLFYVAVAISTGVCAYAMYLAAKI